MTEDKLHATELTSQYTRQVAGDLKRNSEEQVRVSSEIEGLREALHALQRDRTVLENLQQTLGGGSSPRTRVEQTAPDGHKSKVGPKKDKPKKETSAGGKKTTPEQTAGAASIKKAAAAELPLSEVVRSYLEGQSEPRSAAQITAELTAAHPDRTVKTARVRDVLEALVARSRAQRTKEGPSVFYTASTERRRDTADR
ncbi:hypothetical protein [Streptomyces sp. NPDC059215]|uniref:hypothetical protein n=1 Tax=Streptomyces sp. NPDC059215 TaxID=3346772 RepID=UPI0036A6B15D